jgi:hypothetical protein
MPSKRVKIDSISVLKSGINPRNKRPWTLYKISCTGEINEFTTFKPEKHKVGDEKSILVEERIKGQYRSWNEVEPSITKVVKADDETIDKIKEMDAKIADIYARIEKLESGVLKAKAAKGMIDDEDIPVIDQDNPLLDDMDSYIP